MKADESVEWMDRKLAVMSVDKRVVWRDEMKVALKVV